MADRTQNTHLAVWRFVYPLMGFVFLVIDDPIGTTLWIALGLLVVMWRHVFILFIAGLAGALTGWGLREIATIIHVSPWLFAPVPFAVIFLPWHSLVQKTRNKGS